MHVSDDLLVSMSVSGCVWQIRARNIGHKSHLFTEQISEILTGRYLSWAQNLIVFRGMLKSPSPRDSNVVDGVEERNQVS